MHTRNTARLDNINIPGIEPVTLLAAQSDGTSVSVSVYRARRKPLTEDISVMVGAQLGEEWITWQIWNTGLSTVPQKGDKIKDGRGVTWEVRQVAIKSLENRYDAYSIQDTPVVRPPVP